jgi:hypothetical protein
VGCGIAQADDTGPGAAGGRDAVMTQKPEIATSVPIGPAPATGQPAAAVG